MAKYLLALIVASSFNVSAASDLEGSSYQGVENFVTLSSLSEAHWSNIENSLQLVSESRSFADEACVDKGYKILHERYALSFDAEGQICRAYDLSFPHLKLLIPGSKAKRIASIPTQRFQGKDFVNWVEGNHDAVYQEVENFQKLDLSRRDKRVAKWIQKIRFKKSAKVLESSSNKMPPQFYASDIDLGRKIQFSKARRQQLQSIIQSLVQANQSQDLAMNIQQWGEIVDAPEGLLKKIRFDWNYVKKAYDIAIEGNFLPINGPIALVDYQRPHKVFVESLLRKVVQMAVEQVVKRVRGPGGRVVTYVISEAFSSIDRAYEYQLNRLEMSFKDAMAYSPEELTKAEAKRGLHHVFLSDANLVNEYIMRLVQGQKIPWDRLEDLGRKQQYQSEKLRNIMMDTTHNFLVQEKGCKTELVFKYFSLCQTEKKNKMYSLISEFNVFRYNFGPTEIFNFEKPNSVLAKRSISYLLASGLYIGVVPVPKWISSRLAGYLRDYALTGASEEAYLLSQMLLQEMRGIARTEGEDAMVRALYLQNLNFLTPKSAKQEQRIVEANKKILGLK